MNELKQEMERLKKVLDTINKDLKAATKGVFDGGKGTHQRIKRN